MENTALILVADIGGTNARFALAQPQQQTLTLEYNHTIPSASATSLEALIQQYLAWLPSEIKIQGACLALAGPVIEQSVNLTNLGWSSSAEVLEQAFDFPVVLINDFVAYANSLPALNNDQLVSLKSGKAVADAPVLVLGPGTGFGMAVLQPAINGHYRPYASEGGHIRLAAYTELQQALIAQGRLQTDHVSIEHFLCGPGLVNLYQALAAHLQQTPELNTAAEITKAALDNSSTLAKQTLSCFCYWLGQVVGDLVLAHGALGGVVLGGGILPRIVPFIQKSEFVVGFSNNLAMHKYLSPVPIQLAMKSDTALIGALLWWLQQTNHR
ncbi:glucokinase [Shewanella sp. 1CM18E]|uniref:glucokinase n=1 Tax=Shewanella sp. 1CM18E TaxID=2929169 RepID=UPI0020BF5AB4|nr:glucokinase [Shewanella sp. 1CM18E]MCK8044319.1 glucokinase [Shewanella sp. 1CM18E]